MLRCSIAVIACVLIGAGAASALSVPRSPALERPIVDQTNTLKEDEITKLAEDINKERENTSHQVAVLMISSLEQESIEDYSLQIAREWGIGTSEANNGVLLLVVKDDRRLRIEVGTGLEGALPDARAGRIIEMLITPKFRENDYYGGISDGVSEILATIRGEPGDLSSASNASNGSIAEIIFILIACSGTLIAWLAAILARSKSWWAGGVIGASIGVLVALIAGLVLWSLILIGVLALLGVGLDYFVSKNYKAHRKSGDSPSWWAGGGGFGGSSGGSFGGGSFGGGGASGSW